MNSYQTMPAPFQGSLWYYDPEGFRMYTDIHRSLTASVTLTFNKNLTYYEYNDVICPVVEFESLSGCFECSGGAIIKLKGYSSCLQGGCVVYSEDPSVTIIDNRITLTNTMSEFNVSINSAKQDNNFNLMINCKGNSQNLTISGKLLVDTTIFDNGNESYIPTKDKGAKTDLSWLSNAFGIPDWASGLLTGIISLVVIVLVVLIFVWIASKILRSTFVSNKLKVNKGDFEFKKLLKMVMGFDAMKAARGKYTAEEASRLVEMSEDDLPATA